MTRRPRTQPTLAASAALVAAASALACPATAWAERRGADLLVEADLLLGWAEGLGRAPLVVPTAGLEWGLGEIVGLAASGGALAAVPEALRFLDSIESGGGLDAAVLLYIRGRWPRGFAVGAAASLMVAGGVAVFLPRAELVYRWVVLSGLALKARGVLGAAFLWDTEPQDARAGPTDGATSGFLMGFGLGIGWHGL